MKKTLLGATAAVSLAATMAAPVLAVINDRIDLINDKVGIALSPMGSGRELELKPGSDYSGRFRVRQTGRQTNEVFAAIEPYSVRDNGEDYDHKDFETQSAYTKITEWVDLELEEGCDVSRREAGKMYFMMRPKEECYVNYRVKVPMDIYGGSQHAMIFVQSVPSSTEIDSSGIINTYRIGYFLAVDIEGPGAVAKGRVVEMTIPQLLFTPPIRSSILVENTGSLDFDVSYKMSVRHFFGGKEAYSKEKDAYVMAETSRRITDEWGSTPLLGLFRVTEEVTVLGEMSTLTKVVLVIPLALIVVVAAAIVLLGLWIYVKVKKHRK